MNVGVDIATDYEEAAMYFRVEEAF